MAKRTPIAILTLIWAIVVVLAAAIVLENKWQDDATTSLRRDAANPSGAVTLSANQESKDKPASAVAYAAPKPVIKDRPVSVVVDAAPKPIAESVVAPGARVVATFGNTKVENKNGQTVVRVYPKEQSIKGPDNPASSHQAVISFDYGSELNRLRSLNLSQRVEATQKLYLRLGQDLAAARSRISHIAALRSGMTDAEKVLQNNLVLEAAAVRSGRIKSGDVTIQTQTAREQLAGAIVLKDQIERSMLSTDPELAKLRSYRILVLRELDKLGVQTVQNPGQNN